MKPYWVNAEQWEYLQRLAALSPEEKCACGWAKRGACGGLCYGDTEKGGLSKPVEKESR